MREYRGKRIDNGNWDYGWYHELNHPDHKGKRYIIPAYASALYSFEVDPETVGQYTGLKDRNGKKIYEGDILIHNWNSSHDHMLETVSEVKWHNAAFFVDDKKRSDWLLSVHALADWAEVEVIGNIHDNPELLGEG